jgi:hypothetical protein
MSLEELRTLYAAMLEAGVAYKKADPLDVHNAHAALRAARFRYSRASGEYVAGLLEKEDGR